MVVFFGGRWGVGGLAASPLVNGAMVRLSRERGRERLVAACAAAAVAGAGLLHPFLHVLAVWVAPSGVAHYARVQKFWTNVHRSSTWLFEKSKHVSILVIIKASI